MGKLTGEEQLELWRLADEFTRASDAFTTARDDLGRGMLEVVVKSGVGLRQLTDATGLHHSTIRAAIQRVAGPALPDGWEQPSLPGFSYVDHVTKDASADPVERHYQTLTEFSKEGGCLATDAATATMSQTRWFDEAGPTDERKAVQERIMSDWRASSPDVACDRRAIVLAGPPGAGKSTVLRQVLAEMGSTVDQWRVIDADVFKDELLKQAVADGTYEVVLKPVEVSQLEAAGERFFPRELASLVHEESSLLAKTARAKTVALGENIVLDSVLSKKGTADEISGLLAEAGYSVQVVDVEVAFEVSEASIKARWEGPYRLAVEGTSALPAGWSVEPGGRWVPSDFARTVFDAPDGEVSRPAMVARHLAEESPIVTRACLHYFGGCCGRLVV